MKTMTRGYWLGDIQERRETTMPRSYWAVAANGAQARRLRSGAEAKVASLR